MLSSLVLSHISWSVRLDGLKLAELLLDHISEPVVSSRIQSDICRLLKSTSHRDLRYKLIALLEKIFAIQTSSGSDDRTVDDTQSEISPFSTDLQTSLLTKPYYFSLSTIDTHESSSNSNLHFLLKPIEQTWLELTNPKEETFGEYQCIMVSSLRIQWFNHGE